MQQSAVKIYTPSFCLLQYFTPETFQNSYYDLSRSSNQYSIFFNAFQVICPTCTLSHPLKAQIWMWGTLCWHCTVACLPMEDGRFWNIGVLWPGHTWSWCAQRVTDHTEVTQVGGTERSKHLELQRHLQVTTIRKQAGRAGFCHHKVPSLASAFRTTL